MPINLVPVEDISEPAKSHALTSIADSGDANFIQAMLNAPYLYDFYFNSFVQNVLFRSQGIITPRLGLMLRYRLAQLHLCGH